MDSLKRKILTIADDSGVEDFPERVAKILKVDKIKIKEIVNSLLEEKFISIIELENQKIFSHTSKVKRQMLDEDLHYKFGSRPLHTYP